MTDLKKSSPIVCAMLVLSLVFASAASAARPKIVAIDTYTAETAVALGAKPKAVIKFKQIPPLLKNTPTIDVAHDAMDLERLVALKPDWVATSPDWDQFTSQIKQLGFPVKSYNPQTYRQLITVTRRYAKDLGLTASGEKLTDKWKRGVGNYAKKQKARKKTRKAIIMFGAPTGALLAFLPSSYAGTLAKQVGGELIGQGLTPSPSAQGFASISKELVIAQNPDVIVLAPHGTDAQKQKTIDSLKNDPAWASTSAVKNGRLFIDGSDRLYTPGPRVVDLTRSMFGWFK